MKFRSNQDVFDFARRLKETATATGDRVIEIVISEAFNQAGTTATEQLGELQTSFRKIRPHVEARYDSGVLEDFDTALHAIDKALQQT